MTNQQAMKQAKKRWGTKALVRNSGRFSSPERRATASEMLSTTRARIKAIDQEITDRLKALDDLLQFFALVCECLIPD